MNKDTKLIFEAYSKKLVTENTEEAYIIDLMIELRQPQSLPSLDKLGEFGKRLDSGEMDHPEFDELIEALNENRIEYEEYDKVSGADFQSLMIKVYSKDDAELAMGQFKDQIYNYNMDVMRTEKETNKPETSDGPHEYITRDGRGVSISIYKEEK